VHNTAGIHKSHLASLIRFRLGAHGLRVATGRWELAGRSPLPRQQRVLPLPSAPEGRGADGVDAMA
jgi:hypothetical protein